MYTFAVIVQGQSKLNAVRKELTEVNIAICGDTYIQYIIINIRRKRKKEKKE